MELKEIYAHYRDLVIERVPADGFILKTDCFNEAEGDFKELDSVLDPKRTTYIEIDPATVARAQARHPGRYFVHGDIRRMEFGDRVFDCVLDLSTIDHISMADVPSAIEEYHRVLVRGGTLVLVSWCSDDLRTEPVDWDGPQYFHSFAGICVAMLGLFDIKHDSEFHREEDLFLMEIVGVKK